MSAIVEAHAHSSSHGGELGRSSQAGCFYCCAVFPATDITDWLTPTVEGTDIADVPVGDSTALCPKCGIDSVIGDASGFPVTDTTFLKEMNGHWF